MEINRLNLSLCFPFRQLLEANQRKLMEEAHSMGIGQSDIWTLFLRRRKSHIAFLLAFHSLLTVIPVSPLEFDATIAS
ncbi:hypothetical protein GQ457_18G015910 [Hibiscus cannabinus]